MKQKPPFSITPIILKLSQDISWELGSLSGAKRDSSTIILRRINNIKTIQASLAIEGNTLSIDQVSAIFDGKRVIGPKKNIEEAKNAIEVYKLILELNPLSIDDLLKAHKIMMQGLITDNGQFRMGNVGIFNGTELIHMAPPSKRVPKLMQELFNFMQKEREIPWIIKACVFHYELEFIHPFSDGNGRMGRLWQHILLIREDKIFTHIAVETLIKKNQGQYYSILRQCDKEGESTTFIIFCLEQVLAALQSFKSESDNYLVKDTRSRLEYAKNKLGQQLFSRKNYLGLHKDISTATASRDLISGLKMGLIKKEGEKNQVRYYFI